MKKTYKIEVDCANCANKMEITANETPLFATLFQLIEPFHLETSTPTEPALTATSADGASSVGFSSL